jgi:hypothetical protein
MRYKLLLLILIGVGSIELYGQSESKPQIKDDISINITSILGNLLSLNDNSSGSPYGLSYRHFYKTTALRVSVNGSYNKSTDRDEFFNEIDSKLLDLNVRLGYEYITELSAKTSFMYGLDLVSSYNSEVSQIFSFNSGFLFEQKDTELLYGLGPAIRFQYKINDRVALMTESSLYFMLGNNKTTSNDPSIPESETDISAVELKMPQSLFLTISF